MRQEAGRDPKCRLNLPLAFFLAAISASEDTSCQTLSQVVSHSRIIFLANSPFLRLFSNGLASIFCQSQSSQFILSPTCLLHSSLLPFLGYFTCSTPHDASHFSLSILPVSSSHSGSLLPWLFPPYRCSSWVIPVSLHVPVPLPWLFIRLVQPSRLPDSRCTQHPASLALEKNVWDFHQISESQLRKQVQLENWQTEPNTAHNLGMLSEENFFLKSTGALSFF